MKKNDEGNLYTAEDILEFLYDMCSRCENKDRKNRLKNYREQLLLRKNHKIDRLAEDLGIKF